MRRAVCRAYAVGILAFLGLSAAAAAEEPPLYECPPAPGPISVDGNLDEWDRTAGVVIDEERQVVKRDPQYGGRSDLSGRIFACRSATTLYFAGEVHDDTLFWNPRVSFLGDGVEIFLDFHPAPAARSIDGYDAYAHQILLHPLAGEVKWRFAQFRGRPGQPDDPVDGLRLAGLPLRDARGATVGYTFELALPLANFPSAPLRPGAEFGFDVALSDSDGREEQKNYATWSGNSQLSQFPSRFGRMRLGDAPATVAAPEGPGLSPILPLAILLAVLGALLFLWLARAFAPRHHHLVRTLERLRSVSLRRKCAAAVVLVLLLGITGVAVNATASALAEQDLRGKRAIAADLLEMAAEAGRLGLLEPQVPEPRSPLSALLQGKAVPTPAHYRYTTIPAVAEVPHRTAGGVPFLRRDVPVPDVRGAPFLVHPPVAAKEATLVYSFSPGPGTDAAPPKVGEPVGEVRFVRLDGTVAPTAVLLYGLHVDPADDLRVAGDGSHPGAPEARVAFVSGTPGEAGARHGDALTVPFPAEAASPVVRVEVEQRLASGTLWLHGVTLHPAVGEPEPLPLARAADGGVPTAASPFPGPGSGLLLSPRVREGHVECDARADRIWIVASLPRGYRDLRYRAPVALIDCVFDDGTVEGPFRLENGVNVEAEARPAREHKDNYGAELCFEWSVPPRARHFDIVSFPLEPAGRRLVEVRFEYLGEEEVLRISSVTAGERDEAPRPAASRWFETSDDGYRLTAQHLARLRDLDFTVYRLGTAVGTTAAGPARDRMLARTLPGARATEVGRAPDGLHEVRDVGGEAVHTLAVAVPAARSGTVLEMGWTSRADAALERSAFAARLILAALLAPLLVLVVADLVLLLPGLHSRLVAAFAATALVPVVLGGFAVPALLGSKIEGAQEAAVLEKAAAVKARLASLRSAARQRAEAALGDQALQGALARWGAPEAEGAVDAARRDLQRNVAASSGGEARVALEIMPLSTAGDARPTVFPPEVQWTIFREPSVSLADELSYRWASLVASGVAKESTTAGDRRTTLVVELPLRRSALLDAAAAAGGDAEVLLYTPRGYPLGTTGLEPKGEDAPEELERKQALIGQILEEQRPVLETRTLGGQLYTVAYDVLRGGSEVASLVGTAVPRSTTESILNRVGTVSLLVFGAGVAMQFLLVGVVVAGTSRPFGRVLERARLAAAEEPRDAPAPAATDELSQLERALEAVQGDREVYRAELGRLHEAVAELAGARSPAQVVERTLGIARSAVTPWGALLLATTPEGTVECLGGYRAGEAVRPGRVDLPEDAALRPVLAGRSEAVLDVGTPGLPGLSPAESRLLSGAATAQAYPLSGPGERGGALVLLQRRGDLAEPAFHAEFLATLARHVGLALASTRLVELAVHDPETGAYVPSFFSERLREEVDRAVSGRRPIALVLVRAAERPADASAAREQVKALCDGVRRGVPGRAFLGRLDPHTIAAAVPEADRPAGEGLVREIRRHVSETPGRRLRVHVGLAACPDDAGSYEFLLAEARKALATDEGGEPAEATGSGDERARLVADARRLGAVFQSRKGIQLLETVERIATSDLTILVQGETGSGKEIVADLVHRKSPRRDRPLVKVNCAALPDALLESELFGYERGAFTGADRTKPGRFELADGGTLFLDEVGDMPLATQVKLLRVLEDRVVEHLGGTKPIPVDVRVIAATNRDLRSAIADGGFREDLYYRLNAVTIPVPPLRARKEDIPALAESFVRAAAEAQGREPKAISPEAMDMLYRHAWPGNVRELRNAVEQAFVLAGSGPIRGQDLGPALAASAQRARTPSSREEPTGPVEDRRLTANISDRQRRLLALLSEREWITNAEYCDAVGVSARTGLRDVKELVERGVLHMEGKRRGARYRLR